MRIGIDCRALTGTGHTGVQEYLVQLLGALVPLDRAVSYVLFTAGRRPVLPSDGVFSAPNVTLSPHRRSNRVLTASAWAGGGPDLDTLVGGADVFFFPHVMSGGLSPTCSRVCTVHDLSFERFPEHLTVGRRFWHRAMTPRRHVRDADRVIAVSESTARDVVALYGADEARVSVIRSGVSSLFSPQTEQATRTFRAEHRLPERFILAMGTREPRKNLPATIRAFGRLATRPEHRDVGLVIVGPRGWREGDIREAVRQSPFASRIVLPGAVAPKERPLWYASASVLAYPSLFEGFGFPPLEAMAVGTPVVAARVSSVPEVVGDAGLLVDPYDVASLEGSLHAILSDAVLRGRCIQRGLRRASSFSWERTARETLDVLISAKR